MNSLVMILKLFVLLLLTLMSRYTDGQYLDVAAIRLVDGNGSYSGRVEVNVNGVWGTVCDDEFDMNDAEVMCRMMNLTATTFESDSFYGPGIGPIFVQRFECSGNEQDLKTCKFVSNVECTHDMDISIVCTECGRIETTNAKMKSISADGKEIEIACKYGFNTNVSVSICDEESWSVSAIHCTSDISNIRLVNGIGLYDGRVEVFKNGTWGTICGTSFSWQETRTICYNMFGTRSYRTFRTTVNYYGPGTGPVHIYNLDCTGNDNTLEECRYSREGSCTNYYAAAAVACNVIPYSLQTQTRMVNGTGPYDGRFELFVNDVWGTVNFRQVDLYDARTICNTHNASLAMYFTSTKYGQGTGPILVDWLHCISEKQHISYCIDYSPYRPHSSHANDLSIVCTPCGDPLIYNGEPISFNITKLTIECQTGFQPQYVTMTCNGNSWIQEQNCTTNFVHPLPIEDIALRGGYRPTEGRVEIKLNDTWGTICDEGFDSFDAQVICKMFNLQLTRFDIKARHRSGRGSGPIYVSNMKCNGTESHINECSYEISNKCTHYDDVAVECTGYHINITDIRLEGSNGPYHGRVELKVNDTWGTVCHTRFIWSGARFICRMLGLEIYYRSFSGGFFGQGSGPIYIDRLECSSYSHFNQCRYSIDNYYNCNHNMDASVMCYGPKLNITSARLVNGTGVNDGRAEIKVNDTWGTICDENFDMDAADLFCTILGLRVVQYFTGALYGEGSGPVYIDQIFCDNNDNSLSDCRYLFLNECSHARDIAVVCNECGQPDISFWGVDFFTFNDTTLFADCSYYKTYTGKLKLTCNKQTQEWVTEGECQEYKYPLDITDIRLVDGPNSTAGRVELKSLETWGTLCGDAFGIQEANVICRMLGYPPAVSFHTTAHYGAGKGPIFIDDLSCDEGAAHLNNCTYKTYDNCNHNDDVSIVCTDCGNPEPTNGFINSTMTHYGAAVHVTCNEDFRLVGQADIICQINGEWSDKPTCKEIDCGSPKPANGNINTTLTTNGTVATVWCETGYTLSGPDVIICQSNGTWTQNPACDIIDCELPKPDNANVTLPGNKTTFDETAVINCWTGYTPKQSSNVICLSNGTWEEWPECKIVDCGDPVPEKGSANSTTTIYGTVLEISCEPGYNLSGSSIIKCQEDTTWTDLPLCDVSDCGMYSVANGKVTTLNGTTVGASVSVECNEGYNLQGSTVVMCDTNGWNDSVSCQIQECDDPTPNNGNISQTDREEKFVFGNYAYLECATGYTLEGDDVITCIKGGNWSARPTCLLIVCEQLSAPLHGSIDDSAGKRYNSEVSFNCEEGYLLVGEITSKCGEDAQWSSPTPVCEKQSDVGGHCISKEYCVMANSLCVDSVCKCLTGIYDNNSKSCDKMPLLPYGTDEGDTFISDSAVCGPDIFFPPGMPVSGKVRKHVFVCSYGFVSFDTEYTNPSPPQPQDIVIGGQTILAPFYGPIDKKTSGPVYYRSYDILNSYDKMKEEEELISYIENIVMKYGNKDSFDASFVMIATWHETKTTVPGFDQTKTSTFQAVLVSDGKSTFVFYIYGHGLMNWQPNDSGNVPNVWVGYNAVNSNGNSLSFTHPYAYTVQALELDKQPEVPSTENDVAGLVFTPLNEQDTSYENHGVDCINWYNKNYANKKHLDYIASLMPECPCDIWLSRFDPWFWKIGLQRWRKDVNHICVNMLHAGNFRQYGKSCCYDVKTWLWVYERPYAGGFQLYHPITYPLKHILNDDIYKTKCCVQSDNCDLYYDLRPTGPCYTTSSYDFGTFWGDPHFITLDRKNFTFNGLGEYTLLHVSTANFTLVIQARTERALKQDGSLSDATVFSAFAVKESTNVSLHVQLNKAKSGMIIYANKADITSQFYSDADPENPFTHIAEEPSGGSLIISKRDETLSVLFQKSGLSLNISVGAEMLSLNIGVHKQLKGLTTGLLGNYDGNPDNDFTMPNGTVLPENIKERQIFEYGKTWSIDADDSVFIYEEGQSHTDFHNDSYIPRFLDEADPEVVLWAENKCNGSQNMECVFDLVFTEKIEVANQTSIIRGESDSTKSELEIAVPLLSGCDVIFAEKGQNVSCKLSYDFKNEVVFLENNVEAKLDVSSSSITYFQETSDPVKIRVATRNEVGRSSPGFIVNIVLCTLCNGHGVCSNQTRENVKGTDHFRYAKCICEPQYQGDDCELDFDGCASKPCSLKRECTPLTAEQQKTLNKSHICGPCPNGYDVDATDQCIDVNECVDNKDDCEHICTNKDGSFECSCRDGFKVDSKNKNKCKDINECDLALHNCSHMCVNNEGGFSCQCYPGYAFDTTTWKCLEIPVDESCNSSEKSACSNTSGCLVIDGTPRCFCTEGYELDDSKTTCKDIDECSRGVCPQDCVNTEGSFKCVCFTGFKLQDDNNCRACSPPYWREDCTQKCVCTGRGADRCDPVKGCMCKPGWYGDKCDNDINECAADVEVCNDPLKSCVNNLGSFSCACRLGYKLTEENKCEDIDECADIRLNDCMQECTNVVGSYSCKCNQGFTRVNGTSCRDIDECTLGQDKCEHKCSNNVGFYTCSCHFGYSLSDDRHTCNKVSDSCLTIKNLTCSHFCVLSDGDATCGCMKGFYLDTDNETCSDINECKDNDKNKCHTNATCINTAGSFSCECPVGTQLENDGRTCTECDDYHYGKNCSHTCSCLNGYCDKVKGCLCEQGWFGDSCDIDINECETGLISCRAQNTMCENLLGGAACFCQPGYENSTGQCLDVDECVDTQLNSCDQQCINTNGSFTCTCYNGFHLINDKCADIDECTNKHGCGQVCENTVGSYICSCEDGFRLELTDRKTCRPETECTEEENATCTEHSLCFVNKGEVSCTCAKGFNQSGGICEDIDECLPNTKSCNQLCNNTAGSFVCGCNSGFQLQDDTFTCKECESWTYGSSCGMNCSCDKLNTESCDPSNGTCLCKPGWNGTTCEDDINECSNDTACPTNSVCQNLDGSYTCICNTGYINIGAKQCQECDRRHFGEKCKEECTCDIDNTKTCNHVTGDCICKQEWQGLKCLEDVDECKKDNSTCDSKTYSVCKNGIGFYECVCKDGFTDQDGVCTDINECLKNETNECEHICTNTPGSYECSCNTGFYIIDDGVCKDFDECNNNTTCDHICNNTIGSFQCSCDTGFYLNPTDETSCVECENQKYGENCSKICECNPNTTNMCNNVNGSCTCKQGWKGLLCDIDIDECKENITICKYKANSTCKNVNGSYSCLCNDGLRDEDDTCTECDKWKYGSNCEFNCSCDTSRTEYCNPITGLCKCKSGWNETNCQGDINECEKENSCPGNSTCNNTNGSFECYCDIGYTKTDDELCSECNHWLFGQNCSSKCTCDVDNTDVCDHKTGVCTCLKEWTGENCTKDIDECFINNEICNEKANSTCNNTIGSFTCMCNTGFRDSGNEKCEVCSGNTYGGNCSEVCGCNITNSFNESQTCNVVTGQCNCKSGWNGNTCNDDINECEMDTSCAAFNNTTCVNTMGSFECSCVRGFTASTDGTCNKETPTTTLRPDKSFKHSITIEYELPPGTNLQAAEVYNAIIADIFSMLVEYYKRYVSVDFDIIINDLRKGSIDVDYTVVYRAIDGDNAANLTRAVLDLEQDTQLTLYGENVNIMSTTFKNKTPCEVYEVAIGSCKPGYQCTVENNIPICREETEDSKINWSLVIGLSAAGLFLILMASLAFVCVRYLSRQQQKKRQEKRRWKSASFADDNYGYVLDDDKVHRWKEASSNQSEWRGSNWRNILTGPSVFRRSEHESTYDQPYRGPHVRKPSYSFADNGGHRF